MIREGWEANALAGEEMLALILAGGEGQRIGGGKPNRRLGEKTLVERAWQRCCGWSADPLVSVRSSKQMPALPYPTLPDRAGIGGPLAGLAAGLDLASRIGRRFLLVVPCDMPFLPDDLPVRLRAGIGERAVAIASSSGQAHPVCALWRAETVRKLDAYVATGRRSLTAFAEAAGSVCVEWPSEAFLNINTQADLAEAERRFGSEVEHLDERTSSEGNGSRPQPNQ